MRKLVISEQSVQGSLSLRCDWPSPTVFTIIEPRTGVYNLSILVQSHRDMCYYGVYT